MGGVSCMVVFQLAQGPKLVEMPYELATEGEESKVAKIHKRIIRARNLVPSLCRRDLNIR